MSEKARELVRCDGFDIGTEDHGCIVMHGSFNGEGWGQGFGYAIDIEFVRGMLGVFGVGRLQQINGKPCWITHDHCSISKVEPLFGKDGETFDVEAWAREAQARAASKKVARK